MWNTEQNVDIRRLEVNRIVLGLIIGAASGILQYYLLLKFTTALTGGMFNKKAVLFAVTQFFLPLAVFLSCIFFLGEDILGENYLMWTGIGMAAALIISAVVKYLTALKSKDSK